MIIYGNVYTKLNYYLGGINYDSDRRISQRTNQSS